MILRALGISIALAFLCFAGDARVYAQEGESDWVYPQHVPGYLDDTYPPILISDSDRTVHAFVTQWVGDSDQQLAIVYRKWTLDGGWTAPVDVILLSSENARVHGAFLDQAGRLHIIIWSDASGGSSLYYAWAPALQADQAPAWSNPIVIGYDAISTSSAAIAGDNIGNLVVIYSGNGDGNGVYSLHSSDAGESWSTSTPVFLTDDSFFIPYSIRITLDDYGNAHAAWNVVDSTGTDISLHYAQYNIDQGAWKDALTLDERVDVGDGFGPSFPSIASIGDEVIIMYNGGNTSSSGALALGRPVQKVITSKDRGQSWGEIVQPFPYHQGRSGEHSLAVDGDGILHAVFIQRIDQVVNGEYIPLGGIWHSEYDGNIWSEPENLPIPYPAHDLQSVVRQGNVLLIAWRTDPGGELNGVWSSYKILDVPEQPVAPIPTNPTVTQPAGGNISPGATITSSLDGTQVPDLNTPDWVNTSVPKSRTNPGIILILALIPVFMILVIVLLMMRFYNR